MPQVAAVLTPSSASPIAAAIIAAYRDLMGRDPPAKSSWLWPLALSANETDSWTSMYNWQVGNVITIHPDSDPWFYNPHVTSTALKFVSFDGPRSGARAMLKTLKNHGGIDAADSGDRDGWQKALNAYLGAGETYPSLWGRVSHLENTVPDGGFEGGYELVGSPVRVAPVALIALTALGLTAAAAYAAHQRHRMLPT